jgi:hypothetical protein
MLGEPHVAPLTAFVSALRQRDVGQVPNFDPLDGGVLARALFLFEKPGPGAAASGFISRNNDDPSAETTFRFMQEVALPRKITCTWNTVPGWNGTREVTGAELRFGIQCLKGLFGLLPHLKVAVLVGRKAQRAAKLLNGVPVLSSFHPSPQVYRFSRERWQSIPAVWKQVQGYIV